MRYVSTRGQAPEVDFVTAMLTGLAPDGGLYVPVATPSLPEDWTQWSYQDSIVGSLGLFGAEDVEGAVIGAAARFDHPQIAPIREVGERRVLELFWGPTLSFKDHALQVVARLLDREVEHGTILGATSGDTGSAAIEACRKSHHLEVVILFPEGKVSEFQRRQMTTVPDLNVTAVAVRGTFDDCQAMIKDAFAANPDLLAINSINWARIACQVGYYIHAGARMGEPFDVVVPTGNFGNVYSCWTAKQMGVPIETITIANNANHMLADLIHGDDAGPDGVVATTAPAMDIAIPSNLERFVADPSEEFEAGWSTDDEIRQTIARVHRDHGYIIDTHTATAWRAGAETLTDRPQLVVSTAHPVKFGDAVGEAIGSPPPMPEPLDRLFDLPERMMTIDADPSDLAALIR
ncbi:MAG: threonine synthase [Actinomycetota bacterium]|nr:threonine synthase [Actinomycetota bacterium]